MGPIKPERFREALHLLYAWNPQYCKLAYLCNCLSSVSQLRILQAIVLAIFKLLPYETKMSTLIRFVTLFFFSLLFLKTSVALSENRAAAGSPETVIHLLDYLAKDYGGAVRNGTVVSKSEYQEQLEFAGIVSNHVDNIESLNRDKSFVKEVARLKNLINSKGPAIEVAALSRDLQQKVISLANVEVVPKSQPDLALGAKIFQQQCASCHGSTGHGEGPAGQYLNPKPANFFEDDLVLNSAPYKFFNTIRLGVPGTGMSAFPHLNDEEVWSIAFYLKSLPYSNQHSEVEQTLIQLRDAATLTDQELLAQIPGDKTSAKAVVASLRKQGYAAIDDNPLAVAEKLITASAHAAKERNFPLANELALRAYLEGIEPLEPKMKANLPGFVEEIETLMSRFRRQISQDADASKIEAQKMEILGKLKEVRKLFSESKMSAGVAFGAAFSIFLREGFEAVLIIVILISILRGMNESQAVKWVHAGWISAVGLGVVTWFASGLLLKMSGLSRELLEGMISVCAVIVLVYVGFWLHRYSEVKKWRVFLESKLKSGIDKRSYFALSVVAFMAVFREAFEVILFLRAIWIDLDASGQTVASMGILSSLALLTLASYFVIRGSKKLPLTSLFKVCSWTMMALSVVLLGKGLHSLQEAGIINVEPLKIPIRVTTA